MCNNNIGGCCGLSAISRRYNRLLKHRRCKVCHDAGVDASKNRDEAGAGDSPSPVANQSGCVAPRRRREHSARTAP